MPGRQGYSELLREIGIPQASREGTFEVVLEMLEGRPGARVLDVPSGPGLLSEALRRLGYEVTAGDLNAEAFALHGTIPFQQLDLEEKLPFGDGSFDVVYCGDGIEHLENPFAAFREFARILDVGGSVIIATPNYLNLERKLRFFLTGAVTKPLRRQPGFGSGPKRDRGHINPITLIRLAYMAECAGLELARSFTILKKPRQRIMAPIAWLVLLYRMFLSERDRQNLWAEQSLSLKMLLGGKKLFTEFKKA
jgi:SAM-dependent methyltransferase